MSSKTLSVKDKAFALVQDALKNGRDSILLTAESIAKEYGEKAKALTLESAEQVAGVAAAHIRNGLPVSMVADALRKVGVWFTTALATLTLKKAREALKKFIGSILEGLTGLLGGLAGAIGL